MSKEIFMHSWSNCDWPSSYSLDLP